MSQLDTELIFYSPEKTGAWILIYIVAPILSGLLIASFLHRLSTLSQRMTKLISFIWLAAILVVSVINKSYWNYFLRRPGVFQEVSGKKEIQAFHTLSNVDYSVSSGRKNLEFKADTPNLEELKNTPKSYYQFFARSIHPDDEILEDKTGNQLLTDRQVGYIEEQIAQAGVVDDAGPPLFGFSGRAISFRKRNEAFLFLSLHGSQQVANDHYHHYEILFQLENEDYILSKYHKIYYDSAGMEYTEFSSVGPPLSFLLLSLLIIILVVSKVIVIGWKKSRKQASVS